MSGSKAPLVSVVIPVYNGRRFIAAALQSAFEQTYRPLECIVVDDGSTDGSEDIIRRFPATYIRQEQGGPGAARNAGVRASDGPLLAFLDQDDQWHPDKLKLQVEALCIRQEAGFAVSLQETRLAEGAGKPPWISQEQLGRNDGYLPGMLVVRREIFERVGPFREDYLTSSDAEWFFRAKEMGIQHTRVMQPLLFRLVHQENQSRDVPTTHRELLKIVRESIGRRRTT